MGTLSREEAEARVRTLPGWTLTERSIQKEFVFAGFPQAVAFIQRLVPDAEAADHHPDVLIHYRRVTLTYTTHSEGGLTEKDFTGATLAERVVSG